MLSALQDGAVQEFFRDLVRTQPERARESNYCDESCSDVHNSNANSVHSSSRPLIRQFALCCNQHSILPESSYCRIQHERGCLT